MMLLYLAPLSLMLLSLPLAMRRVPRNSWYGLHTTRSMQGSREDWYRLNQQAGVNLLYAAAADLLITLSVRLLGPLHTGTVVVLVVLLPFLVTLALLGMLQQQQRSSR